MTQECIKCGTGRRDLENHHIIPRACGGGDRDDNRATLCHRCHQFAAGPELAPAVNDYHRLFSDFVRTRARPEYDLLRFGIHGGDRFSHLAGDAVAAVAVGADREHSAPKNPAAIWIFAALLAGYGEVKELVEETIAEQLADE